MKFFFFIHLMKKKLKQMILFIDFQKNEKENKNEYFVFMKVLI